MSTKPPSGPDAARIRRLQARRQACLDELTDIERALSYLGVSASRPTLYTEALTPTEQKILKLLRTGKTEAQVGSSIRRSRHTVHVHVRNIYRKLGVNSRQEVMPA